MTRLRVPRGVRARLLATTVAAVAAALAVLVVGFNLLLQRRLDSEATDLARARATATLAPLSVRGGHVVISESPDAAAAGTQIWVFDHSRAVEAPRAPAAIASAARRLATSSSGSSRTVNGVRLVSVDVVSGGRRVGTVVGGVSLAPYRQAGDVALAGSLVLAALVLVAVALITRMILARALRPVAAMTSTATEWSEESADRRFNLGTPHDELTQLGATLDGLLDRIAETLRREQRLTAEISHELRTPLARIAAEAELAVRRERTPADYERALRAITRNADRLRRIIEALLETARAEAGSHRGRADAQAVVELAVEACEQVAGERGIEIVVERPSRAGLVVAVDSDVASRVLQPVLENACRYAASRVTVAVRPGAASVVYVVSDDGPGVGDGELEVIFDPGRRGDTVDGNPDGVGLGLALSRRLARAAGGEVEALPSQAGAEFSVRLPAAT
jgi:signal transduction histidine kinase